MKKGLRENQILVVIKKPGEEPYVEPLFDNTLGAFQEAVGGYIETLTFATDACFVLNEEGLLQNLPYNFAAFGNIFVGTVICVGVKGDEFVSLKASAVPLIMQLMRGK